MVIISRKHSSPLNKDSEQKSHEIVGELYSQNRHYYIVSIDNISLDCSKQFEINGQTYALIEDEKS